MKALENWFRHAWIVLLVAGVVVALDQWTKTLVRANLPKHEAVPVLGPYLMWEHVDNYGAAFGLFRSLNVVLPFVALAVSIAILIYVRSIPQERVLLRLLLGLQVGGALGNLVDRLQQGYVTDFVKMGIPGVYYWPNWNVADAAIVVGVIGLAIYIIAEDITTSRRARREGQTAAGSE